MTPLMKTTGRALRLGAHGTHPNNSQDARRLTQLAYARLAIAADAMEATAEALSEFEAGAARELRADIDRVLRRARNLVHYVRGSRSAACEVEP